MIAALRLLWPFTRGRRRAFAGGLAGTLLVTVAELARPFPLKVVVDSLLGPATSTVDGRFVLGVAALVVAIAVAGAGGTYLVETRMRHAGEHVVHDLRVALYCHLQRLSLRYHRRRHTGDLVTRLTGDVHAVGELVAESTVKVTGAVLLLVGMLAVSLALDPVLTLAAVTVTPLLAFATVRARGRIKTAARTQRAAEGAIAALGTESLAAIGSVQALGGEAAEEHRLRRRSEERRDAGVEGSTSEGRFAGLVDVLEAVGTALVLGLGVLRVSAGALTPGDLVVMHSYVRRLYRPVRDLTRQAGRIARAVARADRIGEVLAADDTLPEAHDAYRGGRAEGEIELRTATFAYDPERPALRGVSLHIAAGSSMAIVGASGAGKSTLAALLGRFHDPDHGAVLLDGRDLRRCSLRWVRDQIGFVLQDTALFSGTVADNIAYATDAPRARIVKAARAAHAHDFIAALPDGYDTDLGPGGASLSGGQRQRLAIARVLLRDPPVVVLDEPTSGLDAASERAVTASLAELLRDRTTVLITHSLHLARTADRVVVLDDGRLVEAGDPGALLAGHGPFRRLAAAQHLVPAPLVPAPSDAALPQMTALLDPAAVGSILDRTHPDTGVTDVTVRYIRYKPGTNVVVDYDVATATGRRRVVLMAAADRDLAKRARRPVPPLVAADIGYDEKLGVLVQRLPLDLWLPALAQPAEHLAARAGITVEADGMGGTADLLAYKPRRRAVLGVDGHVLKLYADGAAFRAAATALLNAPHLPVATATPTRVVPDLGMTAQQVVVGAPIADPHATAAAAGALLADLHRALPPRPVRALDPLTQAVATAGAIAALLPRRQRRLERLVRRLAATAPAPGHVVCHGDFHARQLLATTEGLVLLDLDGLGIGSPGTDVASYAAHLLDGAGDQIDRFDEVLCALVEGYGSRPADLHWYGAVAVLRRAVFPFRTLPSPEWPARVENMVGTATALAAR